MFHRAVELHYLEETCLEVTFLDGFVKRYDVKVLFEKYPVLKALQDRKLFLSGKLFGYGIIWNDELDLATETVYKFGETVEKRSDMCSSAADAVLAARAKAEMTQKELSQLTGIDQSDISKIERGLANPSVQTLNRIASALCGQLIIKIKTETEE